MRIELNAHNIHSIIIPALTYHQSFLSVFEILQIGQGLQLHIQLSIECLHVLLAVVFQQTHRQLVLAAVAVAGVTLYRAVELHILPLQQGHHVDGLADFPVPFEIFGAEVFGQFLVPVDVHSFFKLMLK
jgi:hypothetical protein